MSKKHDFIDKFFKDKAGKLALWQRPNLPLGAWAVSTIISKIISQTKLHQIFELVAFGAIFTWAWLEIFKGASYFRRVLGITVLVLSIISRLN